MRNILSFTNALTIKSMKRFKMTTKYMRKIFRGPKPKKRLRIFDSMNFLTCRVEKQVLNNFATILEEKLKEQITKFFFPLYYSFYKQINLRKTIPKLRKPAHRYFHPITVIRKAVFVIFRVSG